MKITQTDQDGSVRAELRTAAWTGGGTFTIGGWAYPTGKDAADAGPNSIDVWLQDEGNIRIQGLVRPVNDPAANERSARPRADVAHSGFEAVFDFSSQAVVSMMLDKKFRVRVAVPVEDETLESNLTHRYRWGSAGALIAGNTDTNIQVVPSWTGDGLEFKTLRRAAVVYGQSFDRQEVRFCVKTDGRFLPARAWMKDESGREMFSLTRVW